MGRFDIIKRGVTAFPGEYPDYFEKPPRAKKGLPRQKPKKKRK